MDLDPEAVKQEIEAVKFACREVDARLRSRGNPARSGGILARVSKVSGNAAEATGHRTGPSAHQNDARDNSRRFVNRNWNLARKRTAQGLFADDQAEETGTESTFSQAQLDSEQNGHYPRKRAHRDDSNHYQQHSYPSDHGKPISSRVTFQSRDGSQGRSSGEQNGWRRQGSVQYNPFDPEPHVGHVDSRNQRHHENYMQNERGDDYQQRDYHRGPDAPPLRPWNREGHVPGNGYSNDRMHSMPSRRDRDRLDGPGRARGQEDRAMAGSDADAPEKNHEVEEDGELPEHIPGPPDASRRPMELFVAEKRPEPKRAAIAADRGRNKRMLGALMGHLHKAEKQERTFELSEVVQRRKELEQHAEQRAKEEAFKARVAAREKAHAARRQDVAEKRELLLQQHMKQAKLLCAQKIHHARELLKFIRTQAVPPILWKPARQSKIVDAIYEQQAQDFELWADKQAAKLQAEQQGMRERAEKQWAEIDSMHEERMRQRRQGPYHTGDGGGYRNNANGADRPQYSAEMPRRHAAGPIELTTAQLAMLEREKGKGGSGDGGADAQAEPELSTAQQAMLRRQRRLKEASEADEAPDNDIGGDGGQEKALTDAPENVDEDEQRQAQEDEAEALDDGYLLDDSALEDEAMAQEEALDLQEDAAEHTADDDPGNEHAERFEAQDQEDGGGGATDLPATEDGPELAPGSTGIDD